MEFWSLLVYGILGFFSPVYSHEVSKYDNYTLLRMYPTSNAHLEAIARFTDPKDEVEVLKRSRAFNDSFDVLLPETRLPFVEQFAKAANISLEVKQTHYGRSFELPDRTPRRRLLRNSVFKYNSFAGINGILEELAHANPKLLTLQDVGSSFQGRQMILAKISSNPQAGNPIIFIDAGIHAREWVAPSMALYLIYRLTTDPEARQLDLNGVDWYILPCANPDGYEYSRSSKPNRMWRKTRSLSVRECYGVDGNRNYGFKWGVSGVSTNPCDKETYAGPKPFSEAETRAVRNIMTENANRIKLYVSLHSYGQYLVYPWGYTGAHMPKEWRKLHQLANVVSEAVQQAGGKPFTVMSAGQWYPAAGGSDDYAFGAIGVPYSYTMELTEGYEFIYPESLLRTVLPQFYNGFRAFGNQIRQEFGRSRHKRQSKRSRKGSNSKKQVEQ